MNNNGSKFMSVENVNAYYERKRQNLDFWVAKQKQGLAMMQNSNGNPVMVNQGLSIWILWMEAYFYEFSTLCR